MAETAPPSSSQQARSTGGPSNHQPSALSGKGCVTDFRIQPFERKGVRSFRRAVSFHEVMLSKDDENNEILQTQFSWPCFELGNTSRPF
jgi:hypothetical protein